MQMHTELQIKLYLHEYAQYIKIVKVAYVIVTSKRLVTVHQENVPLILSQYKLYIRRFFTDKYVQLRSFT